MLVMTMMLSNTTAAMAETKSLNDWLISTYTGSGKTQVVVTSSGETNPCTIYCTVLDGDPKINIEFSSPAFVYSVSLSGRGKVIGYKPKTGGPRRGEAYYVTCTATGSGRILASGRAVEE